MYQKKCKTCGCAFIGKGRASMYCEVHAEEAKAIQKEKNRKRTNDYKIKHGLVAQPGVGSGNAQGKGTASPYYKHGWFIADRLRPEVKARRYCERCQCDLASADRWHWVVHHRDHNHYNNVIENLELLCKRCHQIEHECHLAFVKSATTIPEGSRTKQSEKHGTLQGDDIVCPA
ncbi:MAG: HNH nuclease [Bacteriophage sp.]|nr:MAG: HNH nuclease [Bacteriophage sp.]